MMWRTCGGPGCGMALSSLLCLMCHMSGGNRRFGTELYVLEYLGGVGLLWCSAHIEMCSARNLRERGLVMGWMVWKAE